MMKRSGKNKIETKLAKRRPFLRSVSDLSEIAERLKNGVLDVLNLSSSSAQSSSHSLKSSQKYGSTKSLFTHQEYDLKNSEENEDIFENEKIEKPKPLKRKGSLTSAFIRKRSDPARVSSRKRRESNIGRPNTWHEGSTRAQHHPSLIESFDEESEYLDSNPSIPEIEPDRKSIVSVSDAYPSRDVSRIPPKRQISAPSTSSRPKKITKNIMKDQWHEAFPSTFEEIRDDKNEVKRQNIIWEVVKSHMDFCEDLLTVKNVYYQGVKTLAPVDEKNVPLVDPNELFGNLAEVIAVNDELACQFQNIRDHRGLVQSIGPSLLDWIPKIVVYADYSKGLVEKRNRLEEVFQMAKIREYLEAAQLSDFSRKLSIWSMLDAPRTKLPRMKMIVDRLQKSTPEDNEDHQLLLQVCEQLDLQTKYLNDSIAEIEFKVKSKSLEYDKSLPHKAHEAPEGATRLLFNGNIKESNKDSELLLFNNCLLIAKRKSKTRLKVTFCEILDNIDLDHPQISSPKLILKVLQHNKNLKIDALQSIDAMNWQRKFAEAKKSFVESFTQPQANVELDGTDANPSPLRLSGVKSRPSEKAERPNSLFGNLFSRPSRQNSPAIRRKTSGDTDESRQAIEKAKKKHTKSDPLLSNNSAFDSEDLIKINDVITTDSSSLADISFAESDSTNSSTEVTINRSASNLSTLSGTSFMSNSSDGISSHRFGTSFNSKIPPQAQNSTPQAQKKQYKNSPAVDCCEDEPDPDLMTLSISAVSISRQELKSYDGTTQGRLSMVSEKSDEFLDEVDKENILEAPKELLENLENFENDEIENPDEVESIQSNDEDEDEDVDFREDDEDLTDRPLLVEEVQDDFGLEKLEIPENDPESFDSGRPESPKLEENNQPEIDDEPQPMSPRSDLALSDMGSESFVDQSMNFPTVLHGTKKFKFKEVLDVANSIVTTAIEEAIDIYVESENVDSGTDSFSEQMEEELEALASHLVGRAIGYVHTRLMLPSFDL